MKNIFCLEFRPHDGLDRAVFEEWGIADGVFINGKPLLTGPPLSYEKIKPNGSRKNSNRRRMDSKVNFRRLKTRSSDRRFDLRFSTEIAPPDLKILRKWDK